MVEWGLPQLRSGNQVVLIFVTLLIQEYTHNLEHQKAHQLFEGNHSYAILREKGQDFDEDPLEQHYRQSHK